jgi:hypothetical protein
MKNESAIYYSPFVVYPTTRTGDTLTKPGGGASTVVKSQSHLEALRKDYDRGGEYMFHEEFKARADGVTG